MKRLIITLSISLGTLFFAQTLCPVSAPARNLHVNSFELSPAKNELGVYERYLNASILEGIKSELIADKTMQVKLILPGLGSARTAAGSWLNKDYLSFSYENNAGPFTFSAGYVYLAAIDENLGLDDLAALGYREYKTYGSSPDWYLAVDLSNSILLSDEVKLGFDAQISYLIDTFGEQDRKKVSMFLNLPITLNDRVTISPNFQYSLDLTDRSEENRSPAADTATEKNGKRDFYGGVSISFAY